LTGIEIFRGPLAGDIGVLSGSLAGAFAIPANGGELIGDVGALVGLIYGNLPDGIELSTIRTLLTAGDNRALTTQNEDRALTIQTEDRTLEMTT